MLYLKQPADWHFKVVTVCCLIIVVSTLGYVAGLLPQLKWQARLVLAASQDLVVEEELAQFKKQLEQFYNAHTYYPTTFDASPYRYVVVADGTQPAAGWYLRARRYSADAEKSDYDGQKGRGFQYRIVKEGEYFYYDICGGVLACTIPDHATR